MVTDLKPPSLHLPDSTRSTSATPLQSVTILGAGAWGSALAGLARDAGCAVVVWSRGGEVELTRAIDPCQVLLSAISMTGVPETVRRV
ncbi:MAG: glycerol-3-phosphate dehydrogenase, partial [Prochlorothrix sp.]